MTNEQEIREGERLIAEFMGLSFRMQEEKPKQYFPSSPLSGEMLDLLNEAQLNTMSNTPTNLNPQPQQDWKERLIERFNQVQYLTDNQKKSLVEFVGNFIQPLQSQISGMKKDMDMALIREKGLIEQNKDLRVMIENRNNQIKNYWTPKYNEAVKENEALLEDIATCHTMLSEQEIKNEALQKEVDELLKQAMLSPIETERIFQERQLKDVFPEYPDGFKHQYMTGLIMLAKESLLYQRQRNEAQKEVDELELNYNLSIKTGESFIKQNELLKKENEQLKETINKLEKMTAEMIFGK